MILGKEKVHFLTALLLWASTTATAGAAQVTGQVTLSAARGAASAKHEVCVVLWLTPLTDQAVPRPPSQAGPPHPQLIQKNKLFDPHILAVEVGSLVDFPNHDPFFHNVFSLFEGKRFDLGLYEAGSTRRVLFDRAGICYIFCDIHPQMSAVIVVVGTPYFAVSDSRGGIAIPHVPPGRYQVNLWEEHCTPMTLQEVSRQVTIGDDAMTLGTIHLRQTDPPVTAHLNKYGKQYDPVVPSTPLYVAP